MSCYYCDRGPKQGVDVAKYNGVPMCYGRADACMDRHVWNGPKPEPAEAKVGLSTSRFVTVQVGDKTLHMKIWREGGCIFCGLKPRPPGNKMSHGVCYSSATDELRKIAEEYIAKERAS